jgi:hypothetical protein
MKRPRLNTEQREKLFSRIDRKNELEKRKARLYNRKFRRSPLFITSWSLRLIYISAFASISFIRDLSKGFTEEIVLEKDIKSATVQNETATIKNATLFMKTNKGAYRIDVTGIRVPKVEVLDTILIERNIFNKPTYFTKQGWIIKYALQLHFVFYYFILFTTFISLFFNNGLDKFTKRLLIITTLLSATGILCYLSG